jgi:uncharacterized protein
MIKCFFVSDLHGNFNRFKLLFNEIKNEKPEAVFFGGDIFSSKHNLISDFINNFLFKELSNLKRDMMEQYPAVFLIMGNDDPKSEEKSIMMLENEKLIFYIHDKSIEYKGYDIFGYANVPPTPFRFKDWEKYDITNTIDSRCVPLEQGIRTFDITIEEMLSSSLEKDLEKLFDTKNLEKTIILFHSPPYNSYLDCLWSGEHVGSKAIRQFIEIRQPYLTLHGHIHESTQVSGKWLQRFGNTIALNASHSGSELSIIKFDLLEPGNAVRELKM